MAQASLRNTGAGGLEAVMQEGSEGGDGGTEENGVEAMEVATSSPDAEQQQAQQQQQQPQVGVHACWSLADQGTATSCRPDASSSLVQHMPAMNTVQLLMGKKCHCHGRWGKFRFCGVPDPVKHVEDRATLWRDIDSASRQSGIRGAYRLFQMLMRYGPALIRQIPRSDLLIGRFYLKVNWLRESRNALNYTSSMCEGPLRDFVMRHSEDLPKILADITRYLDLAGCWGFYGAIVLTDKVSRQIYGQDESLGGIFLRISMAITLAIVSSPCARVYRFHMDCRHECEVLESVVKRCRDGQLSLTPFSMSNIGFVELPQYDYLISCDLYSREVDWLALHKWLYENLTRGVSLSINVTRFNVEAISVIRCIGGFCDMIREKEVHRPIVRIFVDLWDVAAIRVLNFVLKETDIIGIHYAFNIPSVLMKRYRAQDSHYSLFGRTVSRKLSECGNEFAFEKEYVRYETTVPKVTVKASEFMRNMLFCALKGKCALVFVHHIVKYSVLTGNMPLPPCLGPDMASCHFGESDLPLQRLSINLTRCLFTRTDDDVLCRDNVVLGNTRRYFDMQVLRTLVTEAVVWGNARLDALIRSGDWPLESAICKMRSLNIGVTGLHTVLMRLGFTYFASWDLIERIFENMYYAALRTSVDLCKSGLPPCEWFDRTIYKEGKFIFELYRKPHLSLPVAQWETLRTEMQEYGVRNAQLLSIAADEETAFLWNVTPSIWAARDRIVDEETVLPVSPPSDECYFPTVMQKHLKVPIINYAWIEHHDEVKAKSITQGTVQRADVPSCVFQRAAELQADVEMASVNVSMFVDQCVPLPFYYESSMTPDLLMKRMLKWYHLRCKVGVYKYCAS
ncbi:rh72 [macacine betaherpesvirus 3]|uniref:Rh72 n=3 Tax=Rhesus cytomegalovirus (strain 68-1) TaxID=47929 RepID=Q7TFQ9_RHCM6|nr:rh72 [macacine betaherpesvirus 3]AAP50599.1 rh72 [macacine betaherpesvirus 3]AAZ80573.1 rhUL45 [macacine betaherpesvirus 3]QXV50429.1 ribonucleotide reductase subunit 1 [macacine betaherpesvirus 3]